MSNEKTEVGQVIKSVVISSKDGVLVKDLQRDYSVLVGKSIPYSKLGYSNLEALLKDLPDYINVARGNDGQLRVRAKINSATAHISKLVSKTKAAKSKPKGSLKPNRRLSSNSGYRPQYNPTSRGSYTNQSSRPSYTNQPSRAPYANQPSRPPQTSFQTPSTNVRHNLVKTHLANSNKFFQNPKTITSIPVKPPKYEIPPRFSNKPSSAENSQPATANQTEKDHTLNSSHANSNSSEASKNYSYAANSDSNTRKKYAASNFSKLAPNNLNNDSKFNNSSVNYKPNDTSINFKPNVSSSRRVDYKPIGSEYPNNDYVSFSTKPSSSISGYPSNSVYPMNNYAVDSDLILRQIYQNADSTSTTTKTFKNSAANHSISRQVEMISSERLISPEPVITPVERRKPESSKEIVELYATLRDTQAIYNTKLVQGKKKTPKKYLSTLSLLGNKYLSYPDEKDTPEEAEEAAACVAVEKLNISEEENIYIPLPTAACNTKEEINNLIIRISEIVFPKTNGIWNLNVQHLYEEKYKEALPKDWITHLGPHTGLRVDSISNVDENSRFILYPQSLGRESPGNLSNKTLSSENRSISLEGSDGAGSLSSLTEPLVFPDGNWDVFVTCVKNTADIVVNLVDYSEVFENLTSEMNQYYKTNSHPISEPVLGETYCLYSDGVWHRVQVESLFDDGEVQCYFVDYGDFDVCAVLELNELQKQFLEVPFQAISCELTGLEYCSSDELTTAKLVGLISGKTFVAEVTRQEEVISLVLYDTSTPEDVNINNEVLEYAYSEALLQRLPSPGKVTDVFLSHINDLGVLTLRLNGSGINILQRAMDDVSEQLESRKGMVKEVSLSKMYSAKFKNGLWYRALILDNTFKNNKVTINYIDYGETDEVDVQELCELNDISEFLVRLPVQAHICQLHAVPLNSTMEWTAKAAIRLKELAPDFKLLQMKVVSEATVDYNGTVELFKRNDANELISINNTLALDYDLFKISNSTSEPIVVRKRPNSINLHTPSIPSGPPDSIMSPPGFLSPIGSITSLLSVTGTFTKPVFPSSTSYLSPESNLDINAASPLLPPQVPEVGEQFDVIVCLAATPNNFIVQPFNTKTELKGLLEEMKQFYSSEENVLEMDQCLLKVGIYFAVKYDGYWYRAFLENIAQPTSPTMVIAYLVDYGEYQYVDIKKMQPLWQRFRSLPCQAIKASLADIQPISHDWNTNDAEIFQELVQDNPFVSTIQKKERDPHKKIGGFKITLKLIDTSTTVDICISDLLIKKGIAKAM